jgi:hypothetical protein
MYAKSEETLVHLRHTALSKISVIEFTKANEDLLQLLLELLHEKNLLSHPNMPSLLYLLDKPELPILINYIVGLDRVEASPTSSKGSFFAQEIINKHHASCINLLRNVVSIKHDSQLEEDKKNNAHLWEDANGLLQNALLIYPAYHKLSSATVSSEYCILC